MRDGRRGFGVDERDWKRGVGWHCRAARLARAASRRGLRRGGHRGLRRRDHQEGAVRVHNDVGRKPGRGQDAD